MSVDPLDVSRVQAQTAAAPQINPGLPGSQSLAALPSPAEVLRESQSRFPQVDVKILTGALSLPTISGAEVRQLSALRAQQPQAGVFPVLVSLGEGKPRVAWMPTSGGRLADPNEKARIQEHIEAGKVVFERVMNGGYDNNRPGDARSITDLMWYLQALALAKAPESTGSNSPNARRPGNEGMMVEDPDGRLEAFLAASGSYERGSPHMSEYQSIGQDFQARGVDVRKTKTPFGQRGILFQRLPRDREIPQGSGLKGTGDKRMLFIKMEPHGCRGLAPRGGREPLQLQKIWNGFKRFFLNAMDLFRRRGRGVSGQRGSVDASILRSTSELSKTAWTSELKSLAEMDIDGVPPEQALAVKTQLRQVLESGDPLGNTGGIKQMLANIEQAKRVFMALPLEVKAGMGDFPNRLDTLATVIRGGREHAELRVGNETVLLREDDITSLIVSPLESWNTRDVYEDRGRIPRETMEVTLAGMRYMIANIDHQDRVSAFELDVPRGTYYIKDRGQIMVCPKDPVAASQSVLDLTGGNQRLATILKSMAQQELTVDVALLMWNQGVATMGIAVTEGSLAEGQRWMAISRLEDDSDGTQQYTVEYKGDAYPTTIPALDPPGIISLDPQRSRIETSIVIRISVHPDGRIVPSFERPPNFSFSLTRMR